METVESLAAGKGAGESATVRKAADECRPFLKQRIQKTVDFLKSVTAAQFKDADTRAIELKFPNSTLKFTGRAYATDFVLPNLYFHICMVYALLRHNGVELGKGDFLGAIQ